MTYSGLSGAFQTDAACIRYLWIVWLAVDVIFAILDRQGCFASQADVADGGVLCRQPESACACVLRVEAGMVNPE